MTEAPFRNFQVSPVIATSRICLGLGVLSVCFFVVMPSAMAQTMTGGDSETSSEKVSFDAVQPIFRKHCERCHNEDQPRGDLVLTSLDKVLAGSSSGNVVVAGKLDESPLYSLTAHLDTPRMPPNKPRIPQRELNIIERWIMSGLVEEAQASGKNDESPAKRSATETAKMPSVADANVAKPTINSTKVFGPLAAIPQPTAIRAMASHPNEPLAVVAGLRQVAILNAGSDKFESEAIEVGERDISALRFSPDGKLLLVAVGMIGESGTVLVLDWATKQWLPSIGDESDNIQSMDCNSDASQIAIGTTNRLVKIFDRSSQKELFVHRKHTDWVLSVSFSPDGFLVASGDRFGGVHIWETDSGKEFAALRGHTGGITGLVWSENGNQLISSSLDGTVRVWDMHVSQVIRQWIAHERGVLSLAMDSKNRLLTSGRDGWLRRWSADEVGANWQTQLPDEAIAVCATSSPANEEMVIGADAAGGIYRWNTLVPESKDSTAKVQISFPRSEQKRVFTASAPNAPKRNAAKSKSTNEDSERIVNLDAKDASLVAPVASASVNTNGNLNTTTLSDLEESRRALASVEQSLEQTYQTAEKLEESVARLKQLIVLQEARLKQAELKQKPNRK